LAGRFLVLTPFTNIIAISRKIKQSEERKRLTRLFESIKPENFGIIVRTAAEGKNVSELHEDINNLLEKWKSILEQLTSAQPPQKILSEVNKTSSILRDILNDSFNSIVINDKSLALETQQYVKTIAPELATKVNYY
jgi:ribonuclease G